MKCKNCGQDFSAAHSNPDATFCSKTCFVQGSFKRDAPRWTTKFGMSGTKSGKRADIGIYVRSAWEANYARYLNFLIRAKQIAAWEYEAETFEFPVKRGTRFYTPDFKVTLPDGRIEYHEVKGWMHPKGKTALARMALHHPSVKIILIQQPEYRALARRVGALIPNWEK